MIYSYIVILYVYKGNYHDIAKTSILRNYKNKLKIG